jgi:glycosyltransferase involved in cell wall biosynthesis
MKKITILHVLGSLNRGGIETLLVNLVKNSNKTLFQHDFLVHTTDIGDYENELLSLGCKIFRITSRKKGLIKNYKSLYRFFKSNKNHYDVVHQHVSSLSYITPLVIAKKMNINKRIIHSHNTKEIGTFLHYIFHLINLYRIKKFANQFFACSNEAAKWCFPKSVFSNYIFIPNGVPFSKFQYSNKTDLYLRSLHKITGKIVIGNVGRLTKQKNQLFLLKIFSIINSINQNYHLFIIGEGELRNELENFIIKNNLKKHVTILSNLSNISEYYSLFDLFLLPSLFEGLPLTLIEAQVSNLMCFISDNISSQVEFTNLITRISLNKDASFWASRIMEINSYNRSNDPKHLSTNLFNISEVASLLSNLYTK